MGVIKICPTCSNPAIEVEVETVSNLLIDQIKSKADVNKKYYICTNPTCNVSYFNEATTFTINDIKVPLWFKDKGMNAPVCYCSKITRGEIVNAVENGCSTIADVQRYTEKNVTGNCLKENPMSKCCGDVFLYVINKAKR